MNATKGESFQNVLVEGRLSKQTKGKRCCGVKTGQGESKRRDDVIDHSGFYRKDARRETES